MLQVAKGESLGDKKTCSAMACSPRMSLFQAELGLQGAYQGIIRRVARGYGFAILASGLAVPFEPLIAPSAGTEM